MSNVSLIRAGILEAVESLRLRKCRPDRETIAHFVLRKLSTPTPTPGIDTSKDTTSVKKIDRPAGSVGSAALAQPPLNEIWTELEGLVDDQGLVKVEYKGSVSYRLPGTFDTKQSPLLTKHSKVLNSARTTRQILSGVNELLSQNPPYGTEGIPWTELRLKLLEEDNGSRFSSDGVTGSLLDEYVGREVNYGTLVRVDERIWPKDLYTASSPKPKPADTAVSSMEAEKRPRGRPRGSNTTKSPRGRGRGRTTKVVYNDASSSNEDDESDEGEEKEEKGDAKSDGVPTLVLASSIEVDASTIKERMAVSVQKSLVLSKGKDSTPVVVARKSRPPPVDDDVEEMDSSVFSTPSQRGRKRKRAVIWDPSAKVKVTSLSANVKNNDDDQEDVGEESDDNSTSKRAKQRGRPRGRAGGRPVVNTSPTTSENSLTTPPASTNNNEGTSPNSASLRGRGRGRGRPRKQEETDGDVEAAQVEVQTDTASVEEDGKGNNCDMKPVVDVKTEAQIEVKNAVPTPKLSTCSVCCLTELDNENSGIKPINCSHGKEIIDKKAKLLNKTKCTNWAHRSCVKIEEDNNTSESNHNGTRPTIDLVWFCDDHRMKQKPKDVVPAAAATTPEPKPHTTSDTNDTNNKDSNLKNVDNGSPSETLPVKEQNNVSRTSDSEDKNSVSKEVTSDIPDASKWTPHDVESYFVSKNLTDEGKLFREQEIDGLSLLLMRRADVVCGLGLRLGPALKVYRCISELQTRMPFQSGNQEGNSPPPPSSSTKKLTSSQTC